MKFILLVLLGSFLLIEAAHLNYHVQSERSELQSEQIRRSTGVQPTIDW